MYVVTFGIFIGIALLFTLLAIYFGIVENYFFASTFQLLSAVTWFLLAAACIEIEIPYVALLSNDTITTGTYVYGDKTAVSQLYWFEMMGLIMFIYWLGYTLLPVTWKVIFGRKYEPFFGKTFRR